jgi:hypothetical protein
VREFFCFFPCSSFVPPFYSSFFYFSEIPQVNLLNLIEEGEFDNYLEKISKMISEINARFLLGNSAEFVSLPVTFLREIATQMESGDLSKNIFDKGYVCYLGERRREKQGRREEKRERRGRGESEESRGANFFHKDYVLLSLESKFWENYKNSMEWSSFILNQLPLMCMLSLPSPSSSLPSLLISLFPSPCTSLSFPRPSSYSLQIILWTLPSQTYLPPPMGNLIPLP